MKSVLVKTLGLLILLGLLLAGAGCSKRSNPALPEIATAGWVFDADHQYRGLNGTQYVSRHVAVYAPPGYGDEITGPRYPVLYLLPGYDGEPSFGYQKGNENYFQMASLAKVADRLIAAGEIKPMLIVLPDASIPYGGSFYANSTLIGKWEEMMSVELVEYIDFAYRTLRAKESRAISGHASGGYGAVRIAMKYDTLFSSVSAIDAPLALNGGQGFNGIREFFDDYLQESGITSEATYYDTDSAGFRAQPVKLLLYSMAATFSPAPKDVNTKFGKLEIALPFTYRADGDHVNMIDSVWQKWLANDLYSWLDDASYRSNLLKHELYFETSDHDANLFNQQTELFLAKLGSPGTNYTSATFSTYPGYDARSRSFLYDRLEYILKFHNGHLKDRDGNY